MRYEDWTDEDIRQSIRYLERREARLSPEEQGELDDLGLERNRRIEGVSNAEERAVIRRGCRDVALALLLFGTLLLVADYVSSFFG